MSRRLILLASLLAFSNLGHASLETDGVWAGGAWDPGVWAAGVWNEDAPPVSTGGMGQQPCLALKPQCRK